MPGIRYLQLSIPEFRSVFDGSTHFPGRISANVGKKRFQKAEQVLHFIRQFRSEGLDASRDELDREIDALQALLESDLGRTRDETAEILMAGSRRFLEIVQQSVARAGLGCGGAGPNIKDRGLIAVSCDLQFFAVRRGASNPQVHFSHSVTTEQGRVTATALVENRANDVYYEGPMADREGFERAATAKGRDVAAAVVKLMRHKLVA